MVTKPATVDEYLAVLSPDVRAAVEEVHATIHGVIEGGEDCISYAIPAIKLDGKVVLFYSGWKSHVSMYPIPPGSAAFEKRIAPYIAGKGTLKFPLAQPIPHPLIAEIAKAHLKRHRASVAAKTTTSKKTTTTKMTQKAKAKKA